MSQSAPSPLLNSRDDWAQHWEEYASAAERNPAQAYRRRLILSRLNLPGNGEGVRLLDIGSGQGDLAQLIHQRFPAARILGLELSVTGVAISRSKVREACFVERNLLQSEVPPPELQSWATHAVCSEVIEHVDDPGLLLRNARDYMAPGCRLVVTAPGGPMSKFDKHIGHRKHFRVADLRALLIGSGYGCEAVFGAGFPFFNLYRFVVILRGRKLIDDARAEKGKPVSRFASLAMSIFRMLFRLNLNSSQLGWQMIAEARTGSVAAEGAPGSANQIEKCARN